MKKMLLIVGFIVAFFLNGANSYAQDSTKRGAIKQISSSSEQTDNLYWKKIQQQSLLNNKLENAGIVPETTPVKKKNTSSKRKYQ
ncbi:MAG: hypothetical protein ABIR15_10745 [Chitinophagaceae bacterium]